MRPEARKLLHDVMLAADRIEEFVAGKTFDNYRSDLMLSSAVERQFAIIGEALSQLGREAPEVLEEISEHERIIAFRNILVHGYAAVDDGVVWDIVERKLPGLSREVEELLAKPEG